MARNNNTNTIAQANNTSIPNLFTAYLDSDKIAETTAEDTRKAIINTVITNTSKNHRVTIDEYNLLEEEAKRFVCSTHIYFYVDGHYKKEFSFINNMQKVLEEIQKLYVEVIIPHGAAYTDKDSVTINDVRYDGFCWKSASTGMHCGLYCCTDDEIQAQIDCSNATDWDE